MDMKPPARVHTHGERNDGDDPASSERSVSVPIHDADELIADIGGLGRDGSLLVADGPDRVVAFGGTDPDQITRDLQRAQSRIRTSAEQEGATGSGSTVEQLGAGRLIDAALTRDEILRRTDEEVQRRLEEDRLQEDRQQYQHYANRDRQLQRARIRIQYEE